MAAFNILTWDATNNRNVIKSSATNDFDFQSIRIGASNLTLSEVSGKLDVGAAVLTNLGAPDSDSDAATKKYIDDAIAALAPVDLTDYLKKDGTVAMTGSLAFASNKTFNIGSGTNMASRVYTDRVTGASRVQGAFDDASTAGLSVFTNASNLANGTSGALHIFTGTSDSSDDSGDGLGSGSTGDITIDTGKTATGAPGILSLNGGGGLNLTASGPNAANANTNSVNIITTSSDATLGSGAGDGSGDTGSIILATGLTNGSRGNVVIDGYTLSFTAESDSIIMHSKVNMSGKGIINVGTPTTSDMAANKGYVDTAVTGLATEAYVNAVLQGLDPKAGVRYATAEALPSSTYDNGTDGVGATITASANGALSIDGTAVAETDRVLVKDQSNGYENGIYIVTAPGDASNPFVLTRSPDADTCQPATNPKVTAGMYMWVYDGSVNKGSAFVLETPDPITLGTTDLNFGTFAQTIYSAGDAIAISGSTISVDFTKDLVNDNAGSLSATQIVYVKANGHVDLAQATVTDFNKYALGIVAETIATTATGAVTVRRGAVVSGFSGLTAGQYVFVDASTAGAVTQDSSTLASGDHLYAIGRALDGSSIIFDPQYLTQV